MSQKSEFVQLENSDDVYSVRDRLSFLRGKRVLLIWPEEGTVLTRKLDLVLVQREAMRQSIKLALVTHDPRVAQHARELNISTFETVGASERGRWRRGRSKVFTTRFQRPKDEPIPDDLKPIIEQIRDEEERKGRRTRAIARAVVLVLLFGLLAAIAYLVIPGATVSVTLAQERLPVEVNIIADPEAADINIESSVIPATVLRVELEDTGTLPTSGSQALSDVLAMGSVVFINQTANEVQIPAGTNVSTSAGTPILFRTTADAAVPAEVGGQIEVPIEALPGSGGSVGNVEPGLINTVVGPLAASVTVRNLSPTSGGASRSLSAVTVEDRDRLLATLRQQLQSRAYITMESQKAPSQFIILETIRITQEREDWKTFSAQPGDIADTLTLTMRAVVEASAIDESLAQQVVLAALGTRIPRGNRLKPETVTYECCAVIDIDNMGRVRFTMTGSGLVAAQVNTGMLQERLAGRSLDDAYRYILTEVQLADGASPQITLSPNWFGQMPLLPMRISIQAQEAPV